MYCYFDEDLKEGKTFESIVRKYLNGDTNPDIYGHDLFSKIGTIECKFKSSEYGLSIVEPHHDIYYGYEPGWGYDGKVSDYIITASKENPELRIIKESELLDMGMEQIKSKVSDPSGTKIEIFNRALEEGILRKNNYTIRNGRIRNQSTWFKVNGVKFETLEHFIRRWKVEQNHSWGLLKPDTRT